MKDEKDREVTTLRESLEMAKKRNDHLEKQLEDGNEEMERIKKVGAHHSMMFVCRLEDDCDDWFRTFEQLLY